MPTQTIEIRRYQHPDTAARAMGEYGYGAEVQFERDIAMYGWEHDLDEGGHLWLDGKKCEILRVSTTIHTDDARGHYTVVKAALEVES